MAISRSDPSPVAARLRASAGVRRAPSAALELFVVPGFADAAQCAGLIGLIEARRRPSTIADDVGVARFRTSETCDLDPREALVARVDARIAALLGIAPEFGETLQGQRYAPGQEFKPHTDTFEPGGADYFVHCAEAGNRTWTAMLYLNDVAAGGATRFKVIGKTIHPVAGTLLAWNNLLSDGRPNPATLHAGLPVRAGVKYVLTKWWREQVWRAV